MDLPSLGRAVGARLLGRARPLAVDFEITHRCNLRCRYCDRNRATSREMSHDEILRCLDGLRAIGMRAVGLDGGEPLVHADVAEVVAYLFDHGVLLRMNTNGVLLPQHRELLHRIAKVKISLDGPAVVHDAARSPGSFDTAVRAVQIAREEGCRVELTCVLGPHNAEHTDDLLGIAEGLGVAVVFQPLRDSLLAARRSGLAGADIARIRRALFRIARAKRTGARVGNRWSSLRHFLAWPGDATLPCAAGWINATLDPGGNLFACGQTQRSGPRANVLELGAVRAFAALERGGCSQCWCARVVEENCAYGCRLLASLPLDSA